MTRRAWGTVLAVGAALAVGVALAQRCSTTATSLTARRNGLSTCRVAGARHHAESQSPCRERHFQARRRLGLQLMPKSGAPSETLKGRCPAGHLTYPDSRWARLITNTLPAQMQPMWRQPQPRATSPRRAPSALTSLLTGATGNVLSRFKVRRAQADYRAPCASLPVAWKSHSA